jgi:hypothetical protein
MRPSPGAAWRNFWKSVLPFAQRVAIAARNNAIKIRTGTDCCGNHGEPGC